MAKKFRPLGEIVFTEGNDGRDAHYKIIYKCPYCRKGIREGDIGCEDCEIFFDWSKKAKIKFMQMVEWV